MRSVDIRRAKLDDAAQLADLAARTFAQTFGADTTPEDLAAHLAASYGEARQAGELADPDVRTLLVWQDDAMVGFAQVRRKTAPACVADASAVELHRFYLVRQVHGQGLAAPLMRAARVAARELGGQQLWLGVWEHNPRAIAFYARSGFVKVGSHDFIVGSDRQTDWVMLAPVGSA